MTSGRAGGRSSRLATRSTGANSRWQSFQGLIFSSEAFSLCGGFSFHGGIKVISFFMKRIYCSLVTLFVLSIVVFSILHLAPGDPARMLLPQEATEQDVLAMRKVLGLDKPLFIQYGHWLLKAVTFDFGESIQGRRSAARLFFARLPATLELALGALIISVSISIPLGVIAAIRRGGYVDFLISFVSLFGLSTPRFWLGIILILIFSLGLGWFPSFGRGEGLFYGIGQLFRGDFATLREALRCLILPSVTLAAFFAATFIKHTRANVLEEINKLYVKTARQKGIGEYRVIVFHVLRNALIPIVTILGLNVGLLMGGAVVTEIVFSWPGVGQLLINALFARDYPLIQATLFMVGALITIIFIVMDIIYIVLDPRIRGKMMG
jgi:ABC-type dipeptide/oligopeptide/nickel transport system permease component